MATVTEDYVSFETALLLKKKGFEQVGCEKQYNTQGDLCVGYCYGPVAPTFQMAMKWLRKTHHLSVEVYRTACGYIGCIVSIPSGTDIKFLEDDGDDLPSGTYTKWEYACEASIKYCLENLI